MRYGDLIMIKGFMLIAADTPMIGLDPHPAYAPDPVPEAFGASTWARLYHVDPDRAKLEQEAQDDLQAARDAVEEGDLEDCAQEADEVFPVSVSDGGVLTVMDPDGKYVMAEYTPEQVYGAFGMTAPEVLPDQRAAAWAVIRGQMDALASLFADHQVARVDTEYLLEDGIAGLQEVILLSSDGDRMDAGVGSHPFWPLVSRSEQGRVCLLPLDGTGTLGDVTVTVFENLCEFILDDPDAVIDRIILRLGADGVLKVETEGSRMATWAPPATAPTDPADDAPGL
jgi:hypothetical protein